MPATISKKSIVYQVLYDTRRGNTNLKQTRSELAKTQKASDGFSRTLKNAALQFGALFAFQATARAAINTIVDFEKAMSSLSAITGATGDDLKFFEEQAKEIGATTTLSSSQAVKAFELVGSAAPELLKIPEALAAVTKEAVILAEASGLELPQAADALTTAMNQFNLPASEASRIINVLAAGSKEGAAAIPLISDALGVFGTVAAQAGIEVEQATGLVETLAGKGIKGAEAGTKLRNVIIKLQAAGIGFKSGSFDIVDALRELEEKELDVTEATKLFGIMNVTAGQILVDNVDKVQTLTSAVSGTSIAYDQARVQTDNIAGSLSRLASAWEGVILEFDEGNSAIKEALDFVAKNMGKIINVVRLAIKGFVIYKTILIATRIAQNALVAATIAGRIATIAMSRGIGAATIAMRAFNIATKSNPLGLLIGLVTTAVAIFSTLKEETHELAEAQEELNEAQERGIALRKGTKSLEEEVAIAESLNKAQLKSLLSRISQEIAANEEKNTKIIAQEKKHLQNIEGMTEDELAIHLLLVDVVTDSREKITRGQTEDNIEQLEQFKTVVAAQLAVLDRADKARKKASEESGDAIDKLKKKVGELRRELELEALAGDISTESLAKFRREAEKLEEALTKVDKALKGPKPWKWEDELTFDESFTPDVEATAGADPSTEMRKNLELLRDEAPDLYKKIFTIDEPITEAYVQQLVDVYNQQKELQEEVVENTLAFVEQMLGAITEMSAQASEIALRQLEQEHDQRLVEIERTRDNELLLAGGDAEARLEIIERAEDEEIVLRQKYEQEKKQIARDQAILERNSQLFNIAITTAAAAQEILAQAFALSSNVLTAPLAANAYVQLGLLLASAGLQTGLILSQPLPGLATGTKSARGGMYQVGEEGPEIVKLPTGAAVLDAKRSRLFDALQDAPHLNTAAINEAIVQAGLIPGNIGTGHSGPEKDYSKAFYRQYRATLGNKGVEIVNSREIGRVIGSELRNANRIDKYYHK